MDVKVSIRRSADLPATPEAPAAIRAFVRAVLGSPPGDATWAVELLASELVSNVVRHVGSPMTVRVGRDGLTVRIEVDDDGEDVPVLRHPGPEARGGRGLLLVDALASEWGWNQRDHGKTVWCVVDLDAEIDIREPTD